MQKIPLEKAKPDMVLAKTIVGMEGNPLATEGQALSDGVLRRLNMAGITHLVVQGKPLLGYGMGYNAAARHGRMAHLFRNHQENIFMKTVCAFLTKHFQERL